jgi:glycosyltransferase involved in cell wall biosynthesis
MRIGLFVEKWHLGGVASFCERLAISFAARGHEPVLILGYPYRTREPGGREAYERLMREIGCEVSCFDLKRYDRREWSWRAAEHMVALKCDAIILGLHIAVSPNLDYVSPATALVGVAHTDSDFHWDEFAASAKNCDAYVGVSNTVFAVLEKLRGANPTPRLVKIPYGIPIPPLGPSPTSKEAGVVVACRLEQKQKRVKDLPIIWRKFRELGGKGRLTICGSGKYGDELRRSFQSEIDSGGVAMPGSVPLSEMPKVYSQHDIFLSAAAYEGLPIAVLEAAGHGLFPVLSRIESGHPEIVEQLGLGKLCEVGNAGEFAQTLLESTADLSNVRSLRPLIHQRAVAAYGLDRMVDDYCRLLEEILAARKQRQHANKADLAAMPRPQANLLQQKFLKWKYGRRYGWIEKAAFVNRAQKSAG